MIAVRNILVPTDFSEPASAALDYAKALAAEFGSQLHLFHVVATPQIPWGAEGTSLSWSTLLSDLEAGAREQLGALVRDDDALASRVTAASTIGVPVESILEYVASHDIDLIVMGTHGRGMVGHVLLGSVAERIVRRSPVPVLTLHRARAARERVVAQAANRPVVTATVVF